MTRLFLLVVAMGLAGCNPAARCKASADCGGGVCSGGFCADLSSITIGDGGPPTDVDGEDDGGVEPDAGVDDHDAGDNGRGP